MSDHHHGHAGTHDHEAHAHGDHAHGGNGKYWVVFVLLCILTSMSFFTYSSYWPFKETPAVGWTFMMAVSCCKALLVMLFFMHLWWEANWKYVLTIPAALMSLILLILLIPDIGMRMRMYSEERQLRAAEQIIRTEHAQAAHAEH